MKDIILPTREKVKRQKDKINYKYLGNGINPISKPYTIFHKEKQNECNYNTHETKDELELMNT